MNRWPRLFQNLRASCESDLARESGAVAACEWIGNSLTVASQHYLHLTDLDFDRATGIDQPASRGKMRATAGQKAGQQGAARRRTTTHLELANIRKALQTQSFCVEDGIIGTLTIPTKVPPRGVEPNAKTTGKNDVSSGQRAKSDALDPETARNGPDLVTIIEAWPQLPEAVKADIVAMVRASRK
ncbi:MAG: hypothetical protein VB878_24590 [Pirellulaceae bacterium]